MPKSKYAQVIFLFFSSASKRDKLLEAENVRLNVTGRIEQLQKNLLGWSSAKNKKVHIRIDPEKNGKLEKIIWFKKLFKKENKKEVLMDMKCENGVLVFMES